MCFLCLFITRVHVDKYARNEWWQDHKCILWIQLYLKNLCESRKDILPLTEFQAELGENFHNSNGPKKYWISVPVHESQWCRFWREGN